MQSEAVECVLCGNDDDVRLVDDDMSSVLKCPTQKENVHLCGLCRVPLKKNLDAYTSANSSLVSMSSFVQSDEVFKVPSAQSQSDGIRRLLKRPMPKSERQKLEHQLNLAEANNSAASLDPPRFSDESSSLSFDYSNTKVVVETPLMSQETGTRIMSSQETGASSLSSQSFLDAVQAYETVYTEELPITDIIITQNSIISDIVEEPELQNSLNVSQQAANEEDHANGVIETGIAPLRITRLIPDNASTNRRTLGG